MEPEKNISLKEHTTFHTGGSAEFFATVRTKEELRDAICWARVHGHVWRVIGSGSNILFADHMIGGLTIHNDIQGIVTEEKQDGIYLTVGAGVLLDSVVAYACEQGWWGLENLSHIPGTIGATPIQNVGAYGVEIAQLLVSVAVYDSESDSYKTLSVSDCKLGYRHSLFKEEEGKKYALHSVVLRLPLEGAPALSYRDLTNYFLQKTQPSTPQEVREAVIAIRSKKFPDWNVYGTAGSFFKNPIISGEDFVQLEAQYPGIVGHVLPSGEVKIALGWVLDHVCKVKGVREGAVGTYDAQALVLVNYFDATAEEVMTFANKIRLRVKEKTNIDIEYEVTYVP